MGFLKIVLIAVLVYYLLKILTRYSHLKYLRTLLRRLRKDLKSNLIITNPSSRKNNLSGMLP